MYMKISDTEFIELVDYVKSNYGINLSQKRVLIESRLGHLLQEKGYDSYTKFLSDVMTGKQGEAITILINRLTTNHTFFLREWEHFKYLQTNIIPYWKKNVADKDIRIWSAGCSTGEEPYTLAMLMNDEFAHEKMLWDTKILATDISQRALNIAQNGRYESDHLENISNEWKDKYFVRVDNENYEVKDTIKEQVIFGSINLMDKSYPFKKKFHLILCRNVMIYFDADTKRNLVNHFYDILEDGGYLFIGHSESISRDDTGFSYVQPAIYKKVRG